MKNLKIITLIVLQSITFSKSNSGCSYVDTGSAVDLRLTSGDWYVIRRWENGPENTLTCLKIINTNLKLKRTAYYQNGTNTMVSGSVDARKSSKCDGKIIFKWAAKEIPNKVYVLHMDYDSFAVVQACFNDADYMWVYAKEKHPCKDVLKKIDEVIKIYKLDRHEIINQCLDLKEE